MIQFATSVVVESKDPVATVCEIIAAHSASTGSREFSELPCIILQKPNRSCAGTIKHQMIQFATAVVVESKGPVAIVCEIIAADAMARAIYRNVGGIQYIPPDKRHVQRGPRAWDAVQSSPTARRIVYRLREEVERRSWRDGDRIRHESRGDRSWTVVVERDGVGLVARVGIGVGDPALSAVDARLGVPKPETNGLSRPDPRRRRNHITAVDDRAVGQRQGVGSAVDELDDAREIQVDAKHCLDGTNPVGERVTGLRQKISDYAHRL